MPIFITDTVQAETSLQCGGIEVALRAQQVVYVKKNPGPGEFSSIVTALASITDASSTKRYVISIAPGVYTESNPIALKSYVHLVGMGGPRATQIVAANANADLLTGAENIFLGGLYFNGVTGSGKCLINYPGATSANNIFNVKNCRFGSTSQVMKVTSTSVDTLVYVFDCLLGYSDAFDTGFLATTTGAGKTRLHLGHINAGNFVTPYFSYIGYSTAGCTLEIVGGNYDSHGAVVSGACFQVDSGGESVVTAAHIAGFAKALYTINSGTAPNINWTADLENNTKDLQIDHVGTIGVFNGVAEFSKISNSAPDTTNLSFVDPIVGDFDVSRITHTRGLATDITSVTAAAQTTQLLSTDAHAVVVVGTVAGQIVQLPNATTLRNGHQVWIINASTAQVTTRQFDGSSSIILVPSASVRYILQDNSTTAGVWHRAVASSSQFVGTYLVTASYTANAGVGRYLEVYPSNSSDTAPFLIIGASTLVSLSLVATSSSTGTISIIKNTSTTVATISLAAQTSNSSVSLNVPLVPGDLLSVEVTSGAILKPGIGIYITNS